MVFAMKAVSVSYAESRQYLLHMVPDQLRRLVLRKGSGDGAMFINNYRSLIIGSKNWEFRGSNMYIYIYNYIVCSLMIFKILYISILQYHPPATNRYIISDYVRRISLFYFWGFARISCKKSNVWTAKQILKSRGMFSCGNSIPQHGINLSQSTSNRRVKQPNIECNCWRAGQFPSTMLLFMLVILIDHGWTRPKNAELQNASGWQGFLTCRWLALNWRPDTNYHEDPWSTQQKGFSRLNKTARIPWAWEGWR